MIKFLKCHWFTIIWLIVILVLCFDDLSNVSKKSNFFVGFDKLVHLGFFFVWTSLILFGNALYYKKSSLSLSTYIRALLLTAFVAAFIEYVQWKYFKYRSAELWDFICDMLGVFMAIGSYLLFQISNYYVKRN